MFAILIHLGAKILIIAHIAFLFPLTMVASFAYNKISPERILEDFGYVVRQFFLIFLVPKQFLYHFLLGLAIIGS